MEEQEAQESQQEQIALGIDFSIASKEALEALLLEVDEPALYEDILKANTKRPEIIQILMEAPGVPENIKQEAAKFLQAPAKVSAVPAVGKHEKTPDSQPKTLLQKIQNLNVSERRMLAMRGGREARAILLKDTNKQVMLAALENPKITETEIEIIAHSRSVADDAIRTITKNREWMKNYAIMFAVATNPKTPAGLAIPLLSGLKTKDLATIEKNKNVAEAIRTAAKRLVQARKPH